MRYLTGEAAARRVVGDDIGFVLQRAKRTLTAAQVNALNATAIPLIGKPGVGRSILVSRAVLYKPAGATPYGAPGALSIKYTGGAVIVAPTATVMTGTGATRVTIQPAVAEAVPVENTAVEVTSAASINTGAGAPVTIDLWYFVVPTS